MWLKQLNPGRPHCRPPLDYDKVVAERSSYRNLIFSISSSHLLYMCTQNAGWGGRGREWNGMFFLFQLMLFNIWNGVFVASKLIVVIFFFRFSFYRLSFIIPLNVQICVYVWKNMQFISNQYPFTCSFVIDDNFFFHLLRH